MCLKISISTDAKNGIGRANRWTIGIGADPALNKKQRQLYVTFTYPPRHYAGP